MNHSYPESTISNIESRSVKSITGNIDNNLEKEVGKKIARDALISKKTNSLRNLSWFIPV